MPKDSHKSKYAHMHKSDSSETKSSSSSETEEVEVFIKHKQKKNKDCNKKRSESSERHHRKEKRSESSERHHSESSSDTECSEGKYCFEDIYKYYKYKLLSDDSLMVAGSDAYIYASNNVLQSIPQSGQVNFTNNGLKYNVDHIRFDSPFCVRESGIYILFAIISVEQSSQFSLFINGQQQEISTTGNNAGAGQTVTRLMYALNKNDTIVIRNFSSSSPNLVANLNIGGIQVGNNNTFLLTKVAALPNKEYIKIADCWKPECLSKKKLHFYKKVLEKMLCDKELMLKGFNVHGTFFTKITQTVPTENNVIFDNYLNVNGLKWDSPKPDQVQIKEDGVYKVFFMVTTNTACQFTICVNDIPYDPSTQGSNKGAGQTSLRTLLELKSGDYITVKNHTSVNSSVVISEHAGGALPSLSALLTVFKVAPLCKPKYEHCKLNDYHKKCYEQYRNFLLHNKCLQVTGSPAYFNYASTTTQTLLPNDAFSWQLISLQKQIDHRQETEHLVIQRDGIYDIFADCITAEPSQITLFVNGTPDLNTVCGRDSGANRTILRQFVKLCKGDILTIRNYESLTASVSTTPNSGGLTPGHPAFWMGFLLSAFDEDYCSKPKSCKK
jgi:hypothetical protein